MATIKLVHKITGSKAEGVQYNGRNEHEVAAFCQSKGQSVSPMKHGNSMWLLSGDSKLKVDEDYWLIFVDGDMNYGSNESRENLYDIDDGRPRKPLKPVPPFEPKKYPPIKGAKKSAKKSPAKRAPAPRPAPAKPAKKAQAKPTKAPKSPAKNKPTLLHVRDKGFEISIVIDKLDRKILVGCYDALIAKCKEVMLLDGK